MSVRDDYSFLTTYVNYRDDERRGLSLPKSDLVRLGFNETLVPEPLNIHRGHTIIVRPVATVRTVIRFESCLAHNTNSYAINCIGFIAETVKTLV